MAIFAVATLAGAMDSRSDGAGIVLSSVGYGLQVELSGMWIEVAWYDRTEDSSAVLAGIGRPSVQDERKRVCNGICRKRSCKSDSSRSILVFVGEL